MDKRNMKRQILVKLEDYKNYIDKYNSSKLDSQNEIYTVGSFPPKFYRDQNNINEEIFNGVECNYNILERSDDKIFINFSSKNNNNYRLDILKEPNIDIFHIGFSEIDKSLDDIEEYQTITKKNESIDVLSRLVWILKDLNMNVEYCIGASNNDKKDRIYEYMMRFVSNWEKRNTDQYPLGWAIYFKI